LLTPLAARAEDGDIVHFGQNVVVHEGEEARDVVCFLCSIEVDGTVHRDMVAFLGNIRVRGHAEHDAVAFLGNVTLGDNASIEHDVVVFAGSLHLGSGATIGNDRVVFPVFVFVLPLLFLIGIAGLIIWAIRALVTRNRPVYPMPPPR
jgi:acetyltransferase-like isoleucine patch superfamily enzyme